MSAIGRPIYSKVSPASRRGTVAAALVLALAACRQPAPGETLLFLHASPVARLDGLSWAPDPETGLVYGLDGKLHVVKTIASVSQPVAVTSYCGHLLVTEYTGQGVLMDTAGHTLAEWDGPFPASFYSADGCRLLAVRSPYLIQPLAPDSSGTVVRELDSTGHGTAGFGALHPAPPPYSIDLANAGALVTTAGGFYFAPVARDEIVKYSAGGVVWTAARGLPPKDFARAGIALNLGSDGRLYALGADDSSASRLRVDVLDTATGAIVATRHLRPQDTGISLGPDGRMLTLDARLVENEVPPAGDTFTPAFALPDLSGDTIPLAHYAGKVTLVDFWASWCEPCREEFPHMAALYRQLSRKDFDIAAISDDVDKAKMRAFVDAVHPPFPILVGAGRMKETYHYRGLPYSILLDRHGRIVKRMIGFGGAQQFRELAAAIAKEIAAP